jgi:hypothetical protein
VMIAGVLRTGLFILARISHIRYSKKPPFMA